MGLLSNLHVKGKPAVLPDHAIRGQSHYFIYRPRIQSLEEEKPFSYKYAAKNLQVNIKVIFLSDAYQN